jgi:uncharacterized membrane protein
MNYQRVNTQNPKSLLLLVLFSMFIFCLVVFLDIPIARQVIGFFYLTFIPGFIFLKILKFDKFTALETILFSVGLSVAFLMIAGLFINELALAFGFLQPLSLVPLMIVLNSLILVGVVFLYLKGEVVELWNIETIKNSPFSLLFMCLPILSIVGAIYVNVYQNNFLLFFMIISIAILFIVSVLSKKLLPSKLYPFALLMIAIALLFHSSLISNYIIPFGSDVPGEYFLFKTTQNNAYWSSYLPASTDIGISTYNDMLSITILPTVYANTLNLNAALVFKILYPLIFSFVPLALYQIWQKYIDKKYAFITAFLFMAQMTFYTEMLGLNRQMIAELFFALLLLVILSTKIKRINNTICFMIFSFALVTSHYALATFFLFFISFALILLTVLKRPSKKIAITLVVLFFVLMFTWYIYTGVSASFNSILDKVNYVNSQLSDFFNPSSRGQTVMTGLGMTESPSIWNTVSRMFAYLTQAFIVFGFIGLVSKRKKIKIEKEHFIFTVTAMAFLAMLIVVPGLANTLNMTRFYHILLFFLAPLCIIGASLIVKLFSKREKKVAVYALLLLVLAPYFLFQAGFVYEVTRTDSWSIPLSGYRMNVVRLYGHSGYTDAYSVYGAQWLSKNVDVKNSTLYADERTAANVLTIHGMILGVKHPLTNVTILADNGVVYLSTLNVVYGVIPYRQLSWNSSELSFSFDDLNKIYTNGGSEVYHKP